MQKEEFILIATRVSEGTASRQEKELFLYHINTFMVQNPEWENLSLKLKESIKAELRSNLYHQIQGNQASEPKRFTNLWPKILVAAAVAFIVICVYFFKSTTDPVTGSDYSSDVIPGTIGATLTLSSGKQIRLAQAMKGEVAKEAGVVVNKTEDGQITYEIKSSGTNPDQINILSTAKGETYILILPDKSKVWLNAASSLTYAVSFRGKGRRIVKLNGEAYFEVMKDKMHPFIVETDKQRVEVLGTHFNINSYPDEPEIKTTLLEGSVRVNSKALKSEMILKPGEQATLEASGAVTIKPTDTDDAVAWTNNKYIFEKQNMETIMRTLSRWYNIEVIFQGDARNKVFGGTISRTDNLSKILEKIAFTGGVHFKIEGRRLTVMD